MGKGTIITIKGFDELKRKLGRIPDHIISEVDAEMDAEALAFVDRAQDAVPIDRGVIKNEITRDKKGVLNYEVVSGAEYSPWIEWGTRSRVKVPPALTAYAAQFSGPTGRTGAKKAIYDWCKRKGIPQPAWYPIFIKIMTVGITPHPFFFPQLPIARANLMKSVERVVKEALK